MLGLTAWRRPHGTPDEERHGGYERAVRQALLRETQQGLRLILAVRLIVLLLLGLYIAATIAWDRAWVYLVLIAAFALIGVVIARAVWHAQRSRMWTAAVLTFDLALLTTALLSGPSLLFWADWPVQMSLRFFGFLYLFLFVAASVLSQAPAVVVWTGVVGALFWGINVLLIVLRPETVAMSANQVLAMDLPPEQRLAIILQPTHVSLTQWQNETVLLLVTSGILAFATWRSRRLLLAQVKAEAARSQLARFFSPNVVERLSTGSATLTAATQPAVILFVDLVGFSTMAETLPPQATVGLLRNFHRRMARAVFAAQGTLDKFIGDCVMATFGTPELQGDEATRALRCAFAMLDEIERWNGKRRARGGGPVAIGIGLHYGEVVVGNVGDEQRLEFTVVGDTVNIAARLERLTRELGVAVLVSGELLARASAEGVLGAELGRHFRPQGERRLRGRSAELTVYGWAGRLAAAG